MVSYATHMRFIRRWVINIAFIASAIILVAPCQGSEEDEWPLDKKMAWARTSPRSDVIIEMINADADLVLKDIAFPEVKAPDYVQAKILHSLLNDFLAYLYNWIQHHNLSFPPKDEEKYKIYNSKDPTEDFLQDTTAYDGVLIPTLTYLIHLLESEGELFNERERKYFEFRLHWINQVVFPDRMWVFWDKEYDDLVNDYKDWSEDVAWVFETDKNNLRGAFFEEITHIVESDRKLDRFKKGFDIVKYDKQLYMKNILGKPECSP